MPTKNQPKASGNTERPSRNMVQTSIRLDSDMLDSIKAMADVDNKPYSDLLRDAWAAYSWMRSLTHPVVVAAVDTSKDNEVVAFPVYEK